MSAIWKTILGFLIAVVIIVCSIGIIKANNDAVAANDYLGELATTIAESYFSQSVINECVAEATSNGYKLEVLLYGNDEPGGKKAAKLELTYNYEIAVIGVLSEHTKQKIIR